MPGGDRTGPRGMGPLTGRAAGFCAGAGRPGFMNPQPGGRGWGRGGGRGWRNCYRATGLPGWARFGDLGATTVAPDPRQERRQLEDQVGELQAQLAAIRGRLDALADAPPGKVEA